MSKQEVIISRQLDESLSLAVSQCPHDKRFILTDTHTRQLCLPLIDRLPCLEGSEIITIGAGDEHKTLDSLAAVWNELSNRGGSRHSLLLNLGGGMVTDLGGFAASTFKRGITYINLPTTLLAMVDAAVGGKTGINIRAGKNLVGAFHQPRAVYIDTSFLSTLPMREFSAGMAEVIKCGALGDAELFSALEKTQEPLSYDSKYLPEAIRRSCALKAKIVSEDERETSKEGGRALLNFGHTLGHAVEKCAGYGVFVHGEAVAIGMAFAAKLSVAQSTLSESDANRLVKLIQKFGLPTSVPDRIKTADIIESMRHDKKSVGGSLRFVLLDGIGAAYTKTLEEADVLKALES